jgi:prefoldin subunit 5
MEEQLAIIEQIERRINKIDKTEVKLSESIKLLEEYRSSLISNVVGGKVEV